MNTRLLITGGNGFVASHVAARAGERWSGSVRTTSLSGASAADYAVDLTDLDTVVSVMRDYRPTHILHLAGISAPAEAARDAAVAARANVTGSLNLAEAAALAEVSRFVFASTAEVYGAAFNDGVVDETTRPAPQTVYARSKLAAEYLVGDVLAGVCQTVIVRPTNHTGPGQDERFVAPAFAAQVARLEAADQEGALLVGNLSAKRDFLDVRDVADAYFALLTGDLKEEISLFNLSSGISRPISDIVDALIDASSARFAVREDQSRMRPSDVPIAAVDSTRLRGATGWTPRISFAQTITDLLQDKRADVLRMG